MKAWESISEACQIKTRIFVESLDIYEKKSKYTSSLSVQNMNLLVKASHIDFLTYTVISKFKIPFKELLYIKEKYQDKQFLEKIINPILREFIPQASFNELITILNNDNEAINPQIESYLQEKIQETTVKRIIYAKQNNKNDKVNQLIDNYLKAKIPTASLEEIKIIEEYYFIDEEDEDKDLDNQDIIELRKIIDVSTDRIKQLIKELSYEQIDELREIGSRLLYPNDLRLFIDEHINFLLQKNVPNIVDKFMKSDSYATARSNAYLISKIVDFLTPGQWNYILDAFCDNDQIHYSYECPDIFISLFKKSVNNTDSIPQHWLSFREKLNRLNSVDDIKRLKQIIDSYRRLEY